MTKLHNKMKEPGTKYGKEKHTQCFWVEDLREVHLQSCILNQILSQLLQLQFLKEILFLM